MQSGMALIGMDGIGLLEFRAINSLNIGLATSTFVALLALAVAFDQLTRPIHRTSGFLDRGHDAWSLAPTSETDTSCDDRSRALAAIARRAPIRAIHVVDNDPDPLPAEEVSIVAALGIEAEPERWAVNETADLSMPTSTPVPEVEIIQPNPMEPPMVSL